MKNMNNKHKRILITMSLVLVIIIIFLIYYHNARKYIKLNFITESDYTRIDEGIALYNLPEDCELTWWGYYPNSDSNTIKVINDTYGTTFDENLNISAFSAGIDTNKTSFIISIGRKLKTLYYDKERYSTGLYDDEILPMPVFSKEYNHKIYLYITDKKYHVMGEPELLGAYMEEFNVIGNVPYEEE